MTTKASPYRISVENAFSPNGKKDWLGDLRAAAYRRFQEKGFPTRQMEGWRYADLAPVLDQPFVEPKPRALSAEEKREINAFLFPGDPNKKNSLVFVDGQFQPELSNLVWLPPGAVIMTMADAIEKRPELVSRYLGGASGASSNPFVDINTFNFQNGLFIYLPDRTCLVDEVHGLFVYTGTGSPAHYYSRAVVALGKGSRVTLVMDYVDLGPEAYFNNAVREIFLEEGARLDLIQLQRSNHAARRMSYTHAKQAKESSFNFLVFAQDGLLTRNEAVVDFQGEHACATLKGLSMLYGDSQIFHHAAVNHAVPHCTSRQFYRNILTGNSKSEFNSLVFVHRDAQKSDSQQLNRNLLLSDEAKCYSRPQLRIDADDVSCTHGATVGQLEEEELFYLYSRGIRKEDARYLLTYGFAEEALEGIHPLALRNQIERLVAAELKEMLS